MRYARLVLFALFIGVAAVAAPVYAVAQETHPEGATGQAAHEAMQGHEAEGGGWLPVVAKTVNFAILAGVLVYFLRTPISEYITGRIGKVREDLVTAAQTRETATRQLAELEEKLKALPAEIDALKARGAEEIVAERARIEQAAEAERQRLLEHTRREIDMRVRLAHRELVEHAAELAVQVASSRIQQSITPVDQARLVDRYAAQLGAPSGAGQGGQR